MADLTNRPLVSVIIPNFNGIGFIEPCLKSVLASDYSNIEVVVIDNASTDASLELIKEKFSNDSRINIIINKKSLGPTKARNIGIENSKGKYIAFIDNDTEVDRGWLKELVKIFEEDNSIGAAQSKLLLNKKTIDSCGHFLSITGFPYEIGSGECDSGQYNNPREIFGAKSAAMFVRRDVLKKAGYFDEDYFMHSEETDLCWRIWLNNYRIIYAPGSIVYHKRGGSLNNRSRYLIFYEGSKNCTKTLIKNLELKNLLIILPIHIFVWIIVSISLLIRKRFADCKAIFRGLFWDLINLKRILKDRNIVQNKRSVRDKDIMPIIMGNYSMFNLFKKGISWIGGT